MPAGFESRSSAAAPSDVDRVVVADDHAAGGQELVEGMFRDRSRRAGHDVRGEAHLDGDALAGRPGERGRVVDDVRAVADARTPSSSTGVDGGARGPASAAWAVSPSPPPRDREGLAVRLERRVQQLVTRHVETRAWPPRRGAGHRARSSVDRGVAARRRPARPPSRSRGAPSSPAHAASMTAGMSNPGRAWVAGPADLEVVAAVRGRSPRRPRGPRGAWHLGAPSTGYAAAT